jgi:hypothetical protein
MCNHLKITVITWRRSLRRDQPSHVSSCLKSIWKHLIKRLIRPRSRRKIMSSILSAQYWDTSHLNVPTRKMIKQSSLEDKEAYLREGASPIKKRPQYSWLSKRRKIEACLSKSDCPVWQTGVFSFDRKFHNFWTVRQRLQSGTW